MKIKRRWCLLRNIVKNLKPKFWRSNKRKARIAECWSKSNLMKQVKGWCWNMLVNRKIFQISISEEIALLRVPNVIRGRVSQCSCSYTWYKWGRGKLRTKEGELKGVYSRNDVFDQSTSLVEITFQANLPSLKLAL